MPTSPSPRSEQLGTPNPPAIRFTRGTSFGASRFTHLLRPAKLLAPLYGSDRYARPSGAFTSRLPTDRSPSPLLGITTTATGLLCWRDLHPLEWQLASLHQIRTCGFPAYGSHLGCLTASARLAKDEGCGVWEGSCEPASRSVPTSSRPFDCAVEARAARVGRHGHCRTSPPIGIGGQPTPGGITTNSRTGR